MPPELRPGALGAGPAAAGPATRRPLPLARTLSQAAQHTYNLSQYRLPARLSRRPRTPSATVRLPEPPDAAQQEPAAENRVPNPREGRGTKRSRGRLARHRHQEEQPEPTAEPGAETRVCQRLRQQALIGHRPAPLNQLRDLMPIRRARISDRPVGPVARPP